jgi:hypothetical protein
LNTLFNPFEYENILSPPQASPFSRALHHAGGLALGYGGLAVVLRKLSQYRSDLKNKDNDDKLRSYASAKYPTVSPDPELDTEKEKLLEAPGVEESEPLPELTKVAVSEAWSTLGGPVESLAKRTVWGSQDSAHLAMATAAAVIGGMAGWKLSDYIEDLNRTKELKSRIGSTSDEIDRILYEELQKKKPIQKVADGRLTATNIGTNPYIGSPSASSVGDSNEPGFMSSFLHPTRAMKGLESLWWLWAVSAFALTYRAGKTYGDLKDPNRKRIKELQSIAKERARMKDAPVLMQVGDMPEPPKTKVVSSTPLQTKIPATAPAAQDVATRPMPKPQPRDLEEDMGKKPEVDKDDPYAHLLTV